MTSLTPPAGKLSNWFLGLFLFAITIFGFAFAAHASHGAGSEADYTLGLIISGAGIFGIFLLVKRGFDTH